ncbi:hypothetical protein PHLGIDRAFT_31548 [Phlebiopsis gigantea 11061_1 CR5-6]|uniref:Uncharacterized protein n=1 Tax=Phlebiopsis gigantea (strain 11061_1 CR5-6) TaxID=745531 RepID=A0A0C3PEV3_PHLG1|nr:hypothetical protein PHLGIDRAFT_31548 [Phlebiopsis gigantea 11061_1 CR5-6]
MYRLFRRISGSIFPRPDRPWDEDATSTAPQIGKKRRMSDEDDEPSTPSLKKSRTGLLAKDGEAVVEEGPSQVEKDEAAEGMKEVTKGVQEVEIDETKKAVSVDEASAAEKAADVPLPESPVIQATTTEGSEPEQAVMDDTAEGEKVDESKEASENVEGVQEPAGDGEKKAEDKDSVADATATHDVEATPAITHDVAEAQAEPTDMAAEVATITEVAA